MMMDNVQEWKESRRSCSLRMLGLWHVGLWWDMSSTPRDVSGLEGGGAVKPIFRYPTGSSLWRSVGLGAAGPGPES